MLVQAPTASGHVQIESHETVGVTVAEPVRRYFRESKMRTEVARRHDPHVQRLNRFPAHLAEQVADQAVVHRQKAEHAVRLGDADVPGVLVVLPLQLEHVSPSSGKSFIALSRLF